MTASRAQTLITAGCCASTAIFLTAYWYLYVVFLPYEELSTTLSILALHENWTWVNVLGVIGATSGVVALPGLYIRQMDRVGALGAFAFAVAIAGSALMVTPLVWDTVLWRPLAQFDPHILDFKGPIYQSPGFVPFFIAAGVLWGLGFAAFGVASFKAAVFPKAAAALIAVGPLVFGLGSMTGGAQAVVRSVGITAFGAGMIWLAWFLIVDQATARRSDGDERR